MMINKRLINTVKESKKYIILNVIFQWLTLLANIIMMFSLARFIERVFLKNATIDVFINTAIIVLITIIVRSIFTILANRMSFQSSKTVKKKLRTMIYDKLLKIGLSYKEKIKTSEVVQVAVEGVEQLETYFGAYLPQFFYAMIAPITLFIVISFINVVVAGILLICVPLIPISIAIVQTWAKKLLSKYWGQYTSLGDTFLENLQGLTTLKIYQSDEFKNNEMNIEAEKFRKITMKVLIMQLNSIAIMDLVAYGGAALGMIVSVYYYLNGQINLFGCVFIILLSVDFFIPMRQLGSFFHIAMNGMAASDKIFKIIDLKENNLSTAQFPINNYDIKLNQLSFSYEENNDVLSNIDMNISKGELIGIVGESGSGKSTLAAILTGRNKGYRGSVKVGSVDLAKISENSLMENITYIGNQSYLFKGTVRDNLCMAKKDASDKELWDVLKQVNLSQYFKEQQGLDTKLLEKASNLSGGQRQRLALARALLHASPIYIFDEATSNIDVESENEIINQIYELSKTKTIIMISHRLANVVKANCIYALDNGKVIESGSHEELLNNHNIYYRLWSKQKELETYGIGGINNEAA